MIKIKKSKDSKIQVGIRCQCQDRAVERPKPLLRQIRCKKCGKIFKTNRMEDVCFKCDK